MAVWIAVFLVVVLVKESTRESLGGVFCTLFQPILLIPFGIGASYAAVEIYLLERLGWWSVANLKTTIVWLFTFAFVTMVEAAKAKERKAGFGKIAAETLSVAGLLTFITELYSFPLWTELLAFPFVTMFALVGTIKNHKPAHAQAVKLMGYLGALVGCSYICFSLWKTIQLWSQTATVANAIELTVPMLLSIGFIPFLYAWRAYVAYSEAFTAISVFGIDQSLMPYARLQAISRIRGDLELLERWRKAIQAAHPRDREELKKLLDGLFTLKDREAAPPVVQPRYGWSPYLAMQFLVDCGLVTGDYHRSLDDDWFASSAMLAIGSGMHLQNNIAYYVEGTEYAATVLKVKLNVNNPGEAVEAEVMFIGYTLHLLELAISQNAVKRLKARIATLEVFQAEIPYGCISLSREDFVGGIKGGYSRRFEIRRGTLETTNR
ncbi:hypothetical protein [Rhizobium sp. TRM95796]|uniref:hypothetical protein n=1 Tax=Rhizobium sp. TRM95796 TaxID=2979862 RepID=UPI0021E71968|nr:hypothetical protein [Rhizobium sp. TRM95796]MCV3765650.1 hypothetical protein [Rhizobium sp. TRM95796]